MSKRGGSARATPATRRDQPGGGEGGNPVGGGAAPGGWAGQPLDGAEAPGGGGGAQPPVDAIAYGGGRRRVRMPNTSKTIPTTRAITPATARPMPSGKIQGIVTPHRACTS